MKITLNGWLNVKHVLIITLEKAMRAPCIVGVEKDVTIKPTKVAKENENNLY